MLTKQALLRVAQLSFHLDDEPIEKTAFLNGLTQVGKGLWSGAKNIAGSGVRDIRQGMNRIGTYRTANASKLPMGADQIEALQHTRNLGLQNIGSGAAKIGAGVLGAGGIAYGAGNMLFGNSQPASMYHQGYPQ